MVYVIELLLGVLLWRSSSRSRSPPTRRSWSRERRFRERSRERPGRYWLDNTVVATEPLWWELFFCRVQQTTIYWLLKTLWILYWLGLIKPVFFLTLWFIRFNKYDTRFVGIYIAVVSHFLCDKICPFFSCRCIVLLLHHQYLCNSGLKNLWEFQLRFHFAFQQFSYPQNAGEI